MPTSPSGPGNPPATPYLFPVPYPAAAGTAGPSVNVGTFLSAGSQVRQGPEIGDYSDAWIELINFSDSMLALQWDSGPTEPFVPPGHIWSARIPVSATQLNTTIALQTASKFFANEVLTVTFYTDHDIRSGYRPRLGPLVPNIPAAAIGPGTLPPGVILPAGQVGSGTLSNLVLWASISSDLNAIQSDGLGNLTVSGTFTLGGFFLFGAAVSGSTSKIDFESPNVVYRPPESGATPFGHNFQVWDGAAAQNALGVGAGTLPHTNVGPVGNFTKIASTTTVGSFGVFPVVAQALAVAVVTTAQTTVLTYAVPANGWYRLSGQFTTNNGSTPESIVFQVQYGDAISNTTQTVWFVSAQDISASNTAPALLNGNQAIVSNANQSHSCNTFTVHAKGGTNILVQYTDPAGTPSDSVTVFIERLN